MIRLIPQYKDIHSYFPHHLYSEFGEPVGSLWKKGISSVEIEVRNSCYPESGR